MERLTISQYVLSTLLEKGKWQPSHSQMVKEIKFNLQQLFTHMQTIFYSQTLMKLYRQSAYCLQQAV